MPSPRAVARRIRSRAWLTARRLGVVPSGQPDRLGEDADLLGGSLPQRVMVYFPDPPGSLYQIEQWYPTLRALDAELGVVVVLQDSRTARAVRERSGLDAVVVAESTTLDDLLSRSPIALCLYVNHNPANFTNLRLGQLVHVSLMHGDSDKSVSVSNQLKAYDYAFVAGQAAVDRIAASVADYDATARCLPVGRPQIDELLQEVETLGHSEANGDTRRTVLYAPTWEGPQSTAAYGSVATHGEALVRSLLDDGRFRVVYRPHPSRGSGRRSTRPPMRSSVASWRKLPVGTGWTSACRSRGPSPMLTCSCATSPVSRWTGSRSTGRS
ncbi:hypothetical protein GCM10025864_28570 [Luteimicrobium album]|uniref:CDP-glycerol:poly(Glycerophosphate) glycerophosphotransferase n=1 Tax=Luteimicrobium album TaxID=1054550 RepID=A0ABQ6I4N6_9MICO|nr:CDP-glycerol glycerophosphotransferase family protein [Luteimicrobium album]GMA25098.1 hypothetical protein GCM10025864_28570 [Luteimicrobium album]